MNLTSSLMIMVTEWQVHHLITADATLLKSFSKTSLTTLTLITGNFMVTLPFFTHSPYCSFGHQERLIVDKKL
jgi:beta-galactosidase beta subunit